MEVGTSPSPSGRSPCHRFRGRRFEKKPRQDEIKRMLGTGLKYELDALTNKDFYCLTKT